MEVITILSCCAVITAIVILYISNRRKKAKAEFEVRLNRALDFLKQNIEYFRLALSEWDTLTSNERGYFSNYDLLSWKERHKSLPDKLTGIELSLPGVPKEDLNNIGRFCSMYAQGETLRKQFNEKFTSVELASYKEFFNDIEGRELDQQQRTSIVVDEDNNLVIAGAGTGKTTTLAGKVAYLIHRYKLLPEDILLISFTNKACDEMKERIKKKMGINIQVKTFHKLGLDVIAESNNEKPSVFSLSKKETDEIFNGLLKNLMKDKAYLELVTKYFSYYLKPYKEENEFKSDGERTQYLKDMNLFGYKRIKLENGVEFRERLKSQEEVQIANFLFMSDIDYTYEDWYEYKTASKTFGQYKPDFKINKYTNAEKKGIYIEHFGIDESGNVPNWFKSDGVISAKDKYANGIKWKRQTHEEMGTSLIETYSYEKSKGKLISNLIEKLLKYGIVVKEKSAEDLWMAIEANAPEDIVSFIQLIQTFLAVLKSNNHTISQIINKANKIENSEDKLRALAFLNIFKPILLEYERLLKKRSEIDFADMINEATALVNEGKFQQQYKYILIDEFQDISVGRYGLIKALKELNPACKLFCVGDDWQSIYRFSGSDISIFTEFEKYFGITSKSYIEKTYRFGENLIKVSSEFILKNPKQFVKGLKSDKKDELIPYQIINHNCLAKEIHKPVQQAIEEICKLLSKNKTSAKILLLGRYNHEINGLKEAPDIFDVNYNKADKKSTIKYKPKPDLEINFLSVHAAKGLEADYVILMNGNSGKYGFPSQISDDPLLNLVLTEADQYSNGEERRLFYVAITRTKNKVFILSNSDYKSTFILELENRTADVNVKKCPWCDSGNLILRDGQYGMFYGCSNFPHFCNYTNKISGKEIFEFGEKERQAENYDAAIEFYKKAIRAGSYPENVHYNYGLSLFKSNRYRDCIVEFESFLKKNKTKATTFYWIGVAYVRLEEYEKAISNLDSALKIKPDYHSANYYRSKSFLESKQYELALEGFSNYLKHNSKDPDALLLRGECKFLLGDKHGAWVDWKAAEILGSPVVKSFFEAYELTEEPKKPNLNKIIPNKPYEIRKGIEEAIINHYLIKFKYQKSTVFNSGEINVRTIKPVEIEEIGVTRSPCVKGYCYLREEDRTFAIERITELIVDPSTIEFGD